MTDLGHDIHSPSVLHPCVGIELDADLVSREVAQQERAAGERLSVPRRGVATRELRIPLRLGDPIRTGVGLSATRGGQSEVEHAQRMAPWRRDCAHGQDQTLMKR